MTTLAFDWRRATQNSSYSPARADLNQAARIVVEIPHIRLRRKPTDAAGAERPIRGRLFDRWRSEGDTLILTTKPTCDSR